MDVTAFVIHIVISIGMSLVPSATSPLSRPLLLLTLTLVVTSLRHTSSGVVLIVTSSLAVWLGWWCIWPRLGWIHSIAQILVRTLLQPSRWCWQARSWVNSTSRIDCRHPFPNCHSCCQLYVLLLFRQDFCCIAFWRRIGSLPIQSLMQLPNYQIIVRH